MGLPIIKNRVGNAVTGTSGTGTNATPATLWLEGLILRN